MPALMFQLGVGALGCAPSPSPRLVRPYGKFMSSQSHSTRWTLNARPEELVL